MSEQTEVAPTEHQLADLVNDAVGGALMRAEQAVTEAAGSTGDADDVVADALADVAAGLEQSARKVTDATEMRALAHPVRVALLEALRLEGTLTATEAADLIDETPANCSFHLRTLAKYGFVEEAAGGVGRQRPWRRVDRAISYRLDQDDPATGMAAQELARQHRARILQQMDNWVGTWPSYSQEWRDASFIADSQQFLTAAELGELHADFQALIDRYADRVVRPELRPDDAEPVSIVTWGHPIPRPGGR